MRFIDILAYVVLPLTALVFIFLIVTSIPKLRLEQKRGGGLWLGTGKKITGLCQQLKVNGINASVMEERSFSRIKGQPHRGIYDAVVGIIKIEDREIGAINVAQDTYSGWYYLDFIVKNSNLHSGMERKDTKLIMKRDFTRNFSTFINIRSAKVVDVEWKGDVDLARELNFDSSLKYKLLNTDHETFCELLQVISEPKYDCIRIRTSYFWPTLEQFDILESIAKHIKSG